MQIPLASQAYQRNERGLPFQTCVNFFAERPTLPGRPMQLYPCPGFSRRASLDEGPVRGIFYRQGAMDGLAFIVAGSGLYSVTAGGEFERIGTVPGDDIAILAASANQLAIVAGGAALVYDTQGLSVIADLPAVESVSYATGYFVWVERGTSRLHPSAVLDARTYDPLDFVSAELMPDDAVKAVWDHGQLLVFGTESIQPFTASGRASAPFVPIPNSIIEKGAAARDSIAKADNTVFFVGDDRMVYRLEGVTPRRISTHAIEDKLTALDAANAAKLSAWTYAQDGHTFYGLDIPGFGTFCFDVATGLWHERRSWTETLFRARIVARVFGEIWVGSRRDGSIYAFDPAEPTYDQPHIERELTGGVPVNGGRPPVHNITLDVSTGIGDLSGDGRDPEVLLDWSDDLGATWSPPRATALGGFGQYQNQPVWRRLGRMQPLGRMFRFRSTDPVSYVVLGARLNERKP